MDIKTGHLIYIHHGIGAIRRLHHLAASMQSTLHGNAVLCEANKPYLSTFAGIDSAAQRSFQEIKYTMQNSPTKVTRLSLVGVSFGGNILLQVANLINDFDPLVNRFAFVTFASPFNGLRSNSPIRWVANLLSPLSLSVRELLHARRPKLCGVSWFKHRISCNNTEGDMLVSRKSALMGTDIGCLATTFEYGETRMLLVGCMTWVNIDCRFISGNAHQEIHRNAKIQAQIKRILSEKQQCLFASQTH